jgi:RimJ/RimL family protein N-acetyltransferase
LMFQLIQFARDRESRAIRAAVHASNVPMMQLLAKLGFTLAGLDTHQKSNHDLVEEKATLLWYLELTQ